jgi:Flp pilus assembly protein TadD
LLAAILAMFTKEIAVTLPLAVLLVEAAFFQGAWRQRLPMLLPLLATLPVVPVLVLTGGELSSAGTLTQTRVDIPRGDYLLTQFPVIVTYLRLLLLPVNQSIDYGYPVYTTFFTPPVFLSCALLLGLLGVAGWLFWRTRESEIGNRKSTRESHQHDSKGSRFTIHDFRFSDPGFRLIAFGIFWFFLTLSIEAGVVPLADVIFEHRLYLPCFGPALALIAALLLAVPQDARGALRYGVPLAAAAILLALGVATWQRNQVWQSAVTLWEDAARKAPKNVRALYNYGSYLVEAGRADEGIAVLDRTVALDPRHADAWHNLGRAYLMRGAIRDALPPLRAAVRLNPAHGNALLNLTIALIRSGEDREAIGLLEAARGRFAELPGLHMNLGLAYAGSGDLAAARQELAILQRLDPALARTLAGEIARARE